MSEFPAFRQTCVALVKQTGEAHGSSKAAWNAFTVAIAMNGRTFLLANGCFRREGRMSTQAMILGRDRSESAGAPLQDARYFLCLTQQGFAHRMETAAPWTYRHNEKVSGLDGRSKLYLRRCPTWLAGSTGGGGSVAQFRSNERQGIRRKPRNTSKLLLNLPGAPKTMQSWKELWGSRACATILRYTRLPGARLTR